MRSDADARLTFLIVHYQDAEKERKKEMEDTAVMAMNVPEVIFSSLCKRFPLLNYIQSNKSHLSAKVH